MYFIKTHKFFIFCLLLGLVVASVEENISFCEIIMLGILVGIMFYFSIMIPIKLIKKIFHIVKNIFFKNNNCATDNISNKIINKNDLSKKLKKQKKKTLDDEISELKKIAQNNKSIIQNSYTLNNSYSDNNNDDIDDDFDLPGYGAIIWENKKGVFVNFSYTNATGIHSERKILLQRIYKDSKTRFYFFGYCLLREAMRTFVSTRVDNVYDNQGVVIDLPDFINTLSGYEAYGTTEIKKIS